MDEQLLQLAIALGLGLLVGLQREHSENPIAGIRTFPIITLFGTVIGWMSASTGLYWLIGCGIIALAILLVSVNLIQAKVREASLGQTTEMTILIMYTLGAAITLLEDYYVVVVVGALVALLLYSKSYLESLVDKLGTKDIRAIMQFAAISLVILPILPNHSYGPYQVFNPREIWFMVVLIVGISVAGYFIYKIFGKRVGTLSSGILGGLISSTATTVTFSKRSSESEGLGKVSAFIVTTATAVSFARILGEVGVVSPSNFGYIAPPISVVTLFIIVVCVGLYWKISQRDEKLDPPDNPAQLKSAMIFAGLYAVILLAVASAEDLLGENGLYIVSFISGLTDVDAITLSVSNRMNQGSIQASLGWQLILIAALSNLMFKGAIAVILGGPALRRLIIASFVSILIFGLLVLGLWPEGWHY